ncbi:hypothetical protein ACLOJK_011692 [Asimina triloba]
MSGGGFDHLTKARSQTQRHEDMSPGFIELVRFIVALKISHRAKTSHARQMHKAPTDTILRMDMEYKKGKDNIAPQGSSFVVGYFFAGHRIGKMREGNNWGRRSSEIQDVVDTGGPRCGWSDISSLAMESTK